MLREMINAPGIVAAPGVYDPITARIAEQVGFKSLDLPGSALGYATCKMEPNLCLENMVEATSNITRAVSIPLVVDVGAGFGEPAHIVHTVKALEHAGAAGLHLEDQQYPKRFHYHVGTEHTISAELMVQKITYAVEARQDPNFIIIARTDAIRTVGFAEGVRRANLYLQTGADMIMFSHVTNEEQIKQLPREVHGPLNWTQSSGRPGQPPIFSLQQLESFGGYKLINYAGGAVLVAYKAVREMFSHLKDNGLTGMDPTVYLPVEKQIQEACGLPEYIRIENETTEKA
jgi:methylisocitrate lyase